MASSFQTSIDKLIVQHEAADAAALKAKDDQLKALQAAFDAYKLSHPDVTPSPPPPPPPPPPSSGFWQGLNTIWPTAATTGPRVAMTAATSNRVSGVVSAKKFNGTVYPENGTSFIDCEFFGDGGWGIDGDNKIFTVDHCRFTSSNGGPAAILGNATITACDISGFVDGIKPQGDGWIIRGCYIHDPYAGGIDPHNDGIQASGPHNNCLIEQNYIKWRDTSAVMFGTDFGQNANCTVTHNWLGGADMPLRMDIKNGGGKAIENVVQKGYWGYMDFTGPVAHSGNIDSITGVAID